MFLADDSRDVAVQKVWKTGIDSCNSRTTRLSIVPFKRCSAERRLETSKIEDGAMAHKEAQHYLGFRMSRNATTRAGSRILGYNTINERTLGKVSGENASSAAVGVT